MSIVRFAILGLGLRVNNRHNKTVVMLQVMVGHCDKNSRRNHTLKTMSAGEGDSTWSQALQKPQTQTLNRNKL